MARGFSNALRIALGGVAGGLEGYGEKQERLGKASLLKQQQERQAEQDAINLAKSLVDMGFRPDFGEDDAIASSMPIPRQSTRLDTTLPTFGAGLAPAMERTRRESFGITPERPVAQPKPLVSALTQAEQVQPPRPRTGDKTLNVPGIGSMRMKLPETPEEKAERELGAYRKRLGVDAEVAAEKDLAQAAAMTKSVNETAGLLQKTFRLSDGQPLSREAALYAARSGKTPIELGLVEKPMTEAERKRLGLDWARLNLDREKDKSTPAGEIEKRLPVGARNDIADYNAAIRTLQEAIVEVDKNPKAFGLMPVLYSKGGAVGRTLRERAEGAQSQAYTKARSQMQSALMKLRKTQFGTQMTRLEKDTGEEVFPSGAESPERLSQMLDVLVGNAEQLRRGVYEANNAADLYQPIAPAERAPAPAPASPKPALTPDQWMDANPQKPGETDAQYEARYRAATKGGR